MDIRIWKLFAAACVGLSHVCCAGNLYRLEVNVQRNGLTIVDATADVEGGGTADLQASADDEKAPAARLIANVMPAPSSNDVAVNLQYLEKRGENWVLLGEPSVVAALGDEGGIEFSEDAASAQPNRYKVLLSLIK